LTHICHLSALSWYGWTWRFIGKTWFWYSKFVS
jgi:hypothetical protein